MGLTCTFLFLRRVFRIPDLIIAERSTKGLNVKPAIPNSASTSRSPRLHPQHFDFDSPAIRSELFYGVGVQNATTQGSTNGSGSSTSTLSLDEGLMNLVGGAEEYPSVLPPAIPVDLSGVMTGGDGCRSDAMITEGHDARGGDTAASSIGVDLRAIDAVYGNDLPRYFNGIGSISCLDSAEIGRRRRGESAAGARRRSPLLHPGLFISDQHLPASSIGSLGGNNSLLCGSLGFIDSCNARDSHGVSGRRPSSRGFPVDNPVSSGMAKGGARDQSRDDTSSGVLDGSALVFSTDMFATPSDARVRQHQPHETHPRHSLGMFAIPVAGHSSQTNSGGGDGTVACRCERSPATGAALASITARSDVGGEGIEGVICAPTTKRRQPPTPTIPSERLHGDDDGGDRARRNSEVSEGNSVKKARRSPPPISKHFTDATNDSGSNDGRNSTESVVSTPSTLLATTGVKNGGAYSRGGMIPQNVGGLGLKLGFAPFHGGGLTLTASMFGNTTPSTAAVSNASIRGDIGRNVCCGGGDGSGLVSAKRSLQGRVSSATALAALVKNSKAPGLEGLCASFASKGGGAHDNPNNDGNSDNVEKIERTKRSLTSYSCLVATGNCGRESEGNGKISDTCKAAASNPAEAAAKIGVRKTTGTRVEQRPESNVSRVRTCPRFKTQPGVTRSELSLTESRGLPAYAVGETGSSACGRGMSYESVFDAGVLAATFPVRRSPRLRTCSLAVRRARSHDKVGNFTVP